MKQLVWLLLFIPVFLSAQEENQYLAGAVPEENGKVVFSKELNLAGYSKDQVYDQMLAWANQHFNTSESRVVYTNREKGEIACVSEEYLVFSSTALSLDRTRVNYRVTIECRDQASHIELTGIRYEYDVSYQREPEKYTAEEWITDKYALNKAQTKLNRISGKFRRGTVDLADRTFESITSALGAHLTAQNTATPAAAPAVPAVSSVPAVSAVPAVPAVPAASVVPAAPLTPATPVAPAATTAAAAPIAPVAPMEGFVRFDADKIPSTLLGMLPASTLTIATAEAPALRDTEATWKGISDMFGKKIALAAIQAGSATDRSIGTNDTYRLSFSQTKGGEPWMIIECTKQGETPDGNQKTLLGEILHVWIK